MVSRYLFLGLLTVLPPAQDPPVRLGTSGTTFALGLLFEGHVYADLGRGRTEPFAITQLARRVGASGEAGEPAMVVRIEGAIGGRTVANRWATVVPEPPLTAADIAFETDCGMVAGASAWRMRPAPSLSQRPARYLPRSSDFEACCLADAVELSAFWRAHCGRAAEGPPAVDFDRFLAIVEPEQQGGDGLAAWRHGGGMRVICAQGAPPDRDEQRMALHLVPRVAGEVLLDLEVRGREGVARRLSSRTVEDPRRAATLQVLRYLPVELAPRAATTCERATTPGEWRQLRQRLGGPVADLPDDWCDFSHAAVVAIATGTGLTWPGFELATTEEEGVDVLTATQRSPSGVHPGEHAYAMLAVVPRREAQLAVVLREVCGPGPGTEKTLRVFAGFGR